MNDTTILTIVAILAVVCLLMTALMMGHNGAILAGGLALVAGLGGYQLKNIQNNSTIAAAVKNGQKS